MGRWDAEQFLEEISAEQIEHWEAFYNLEPFGPWADDLRNAMGLAQVANINRDTKKKKTGFSPADFMLSKASRPPLSQEGKTKLLVAKMTATLGPPKEL